MAKLSSKKRDQLKDSDFGIPEKRMYPLHDKAHIESAVKLFGHAETKYKKSLAQKILRRAKEYNMDTSGWKQVLSFAQEAVPPMSNGTSLGNIPPGLTAPYEYSEGDELMSRVNSLGNTDMFTFAKSIVNEIHAQVEKDRKPPTGNQNCQLCTWCAEARFRGMNVLPRPIYSPRDPALAVPGENIVMNPVKEKIATQRQVIETVRGAVNSRWYVHVNWKDSVGGHEFLVVNINDYAYIMDAQAGMLKDIDETDSTDSYFRDINYANSYMVRLDTKKFNTELFNEMNDPAKVLPWNPELDVPYMKEHGMLGDMSDKWTMRPATEADLEFVYFSELETVGENKNDPKVQKYIREDAKESLGHTQIIVAENSDIGVYQAYATDYYGLREGKKDWWYLAHIYIKPEYRTLGIGSAIIKRDIAEHDKILLQVMKSNTRAKKLYESLGFVVDMENDHGGLVMRLDKSKNVQESFMDEYKKDDLIQVKDFPYDTVYRGSYDGHIDTNPLYITPFKGLASIFAARDAIRPKLRELGLRVYNMDYDEWKLEPSELKKPFTTVHVKIQSKEGKTFEPFEIEATGDVYTFDVSKLKDHIYRYKWMDPEREALVVDYGEIQMPKAERVTVKYIVEPDVSFTQEGAFQDLKNGVNPYSDDLVFHVSPDKHIDGQVWKPRVPDYLDPYNPEDTGFEDNTTPRICFSTSIEGALNGITVNIQRQSPDTFDKMYVYVPEKPWKEYKHKTNKQLVKDKLVYDANVTREVWIMEPVRMKLYGVIRVDQIADAKRKSVVPTSKGQKDTRNYFTYKWHWVVKPKVLKKATKFDYSPERVIDDLCIDIKKFKYGLIKDGRLMTGNVSDKDYDKYWVFHSGETVDQAGGGNCYDMVEYEAGYLEAFGVTYKKYFMNFTKTDGKTPVNTHTICVVPHNGKFIYIEQAFKRVVDEWGHERKKEFDKLNDVFEYVAEVSAEYDNQDLNYGVWDYTNAEIDYGTPIKNFMEWIMTKCKMVYDGEATTKKSVTKESCEMYDYDDDDIIEESDTDMFIELGDMMFYVSEYHNALFDDPDAHDEAINEYGILLDSYDDEFFEETAKPYDDYLRKHNYDPATNTIEDPTKPGRRVNAGRIGSKKERNRMNKFLRENGYDPKTETILTGINDKNNPGQKKRVKFGINSAIGNPGAPMSIPLAYGRVDNYMSPDDDGDRDKGIAMSKKLMQQKPGSSNYILKHEEGHLAYDDAFDKETNAQWNANPSHHSPKQYREDINAARQHIRSQAKKNPSLKENAHDILPTEYQADKYGEDHNPYGRGYGGAALKRMMATVKTFDPDNFDSQREAFLEGFGKGEAGFKAFTENLRQQYEATINLMNSGVITKSTPGYSAYKKSATAMKREIDAGFPESRKLFFSMTQPDQNQAIAEAKQRSRAMIDAGVDSRDAFMKKYETQAKVAQAKTAAKQRQLAKEQLKQQIASGQLTGDQAAKAERKIQRIEAFEAGKQQMQQQPPKQQTQPQPKQDTISVAKQSLSEPTVKKEGFKLSRFNSNRFYQEEEEYLSEDITVGDIDLDDEKDNPEDIQTDETSVTRNTPEKVETSEEKETTEEPEEIEPIENFEDIDIGADEVPEYMKDRLSEEDKKEFESDDNNEMDVNNVELGSFGSDTSDVQNDYDQKEVDILMKLMASEADAMNEYMDGAKETNVDVLRRLYADIANEERFHMEQLLFAKSELTGEKYIPRDPDVKSEYEELLKMGMDENTAMQTAVDKCHIRGISVSVDNDADEIKETQEEIETLEYAVEMFEENFDSFMKEFEMSDREKSIDKFVQEYLAMEAVTPEGKEVHKGLELGRNPITVLMKAADFVIRLLVELCRKIKVFLDRVKRSSANFKNYVQQIKMDPNGWKTFFEPIMLYFMPHYDTLNGKRVAIMSREMYQWYMLAYDTVVECGKGMNINVGIQPDAIAKQYRTQNINGDINKGAEMLNSIHLSREPMVKPADDDARNELIDMFMGYSDIIGEDGKSYNMLGTYQKFADIWRELLKQTEAMMKALVSAQNQVNENPQLRNTYELCMTGLNAVIKSSKAFAAAITKDINTIIKLDSDVYEAVRNKDNKRIEENEVAKNQNQAYKDRFGKVRNMNDANPPK